MTSYQHAGDPSFQEPIDREAIVRRLQMMADLLDNQFELPGTGIRFGLDPLLGLIPGVGDTISLALSGYIIYEASRLDVPTSTLARMVANVLIDWLIGLVPVLGDYFDFAFKANQRNLRLMGIEPRRR